MKSVLCKVAALSVLSSLLGMVVLGGSVTANVSRDGSPQPVADGGQWGQKGGKGVC